MTLLIHNWHQKLKDKRTLTHSRSVMPTPTRGERKDSRPAGNFWPLILLVSLLQSFRLFETLFLHSVFFEIEFSRPKYIKVQ